jgi:cell filamentation protein
MYEADDDRYCYAGTTVLKNKANIREQIELDKFEWYWSTRRASERLPTGSCDLNHYRAIHRHLFRDVYTWAGRFRQVRISKDGSVFCYPEYIEEQIDALFEWLAGENKLHDLEPDDFGAKAAHFMSELNVIHPFREGNGRAQNVFLQILAIQASHPLDFGKLEPRWMIDAMIAGFNGNENPLKELILNLMRVR